MRPDVIAATLGRAIRSVADPLRARVAELESELRTLKADLEERPPLRAAGNWAPLKSFTPGDCVQFDGSTWACTARHTAGDMFDHKAFKLLVKKGRDGRDR